MMRSILVLLSVVVLEVSSTEKARPVYIHSYDNFQQDVGGEVKVRFFLILKKRSYEKREKIQIYRRLRRPFAMRQKR